MTLAEFLHQLRSSPKGEQVLAALYFCKHELGDESLAPSQIRDMLIKASIPRSRKANYSRVLTELVPLVDRSASRGRWEITGSGEEHVKKRLSLGGQAPAVEDVDALTKLSASLDNEGVRGYVEEAISCLQVGARRASVVFLWSGAIYTLREEIWGNRTPSAIDAALKSHNPKAKTFKLKGDFANVSDLALLQIAQDFEVIEKNEKTMLGQALELRNTCGHPVKYRPGEKKVSGFIEDVLQIVFGVSAD